MNLTVGIIAREEDELPPFGKQSIFFQDMINESKDLPVKVFVFSPINWEKDSDEIFGHQIIGEGWVKTKRTIPNIIYDRFTAKAKGEREKYVDFRDYLVKTKREFTTPLSLVELLKDKVDFHKYLHAKNVATLEAVILEELTENTFWRFLEYNPTLYIKPISGSNGAGIAIFEKHHEKGIFREQSKTTEMPLDQCYNFLKSNFNNSSFFVQPKAKVIDFEGKPYDIRILIQNYGKSNYQITGQGVRVGEKGNWISNISAGGGALPLDVLERSLKKYDIDFSNEVKKMEKMCIDCTLALHERFGDFAEIAFDILLTTDKGPIILEGNSKPARWIFNLLADNFEQSSPQYQKYQEIRRLSVKLPLIFINTIYKNKMENFELTIDAVDQQLSIIETADLQNWLKIQKINGLRVERKQGEIENDRMGGFIETALVLTIIARPVLIELVKSLSVWFAERKPKASVKITNAEGKTIEFSGENLPNIEKTVEKFLTQE